MVFQKDDNGTLNQYDPNGEGQTEVMNFRYLQENINQTWWGMGHGLWGREVLRRAASAPWRMQLRGWRSRSRRCDIPEEDHTGIGQCRERIQKFRFGHAEFESPFDFFISLTFCLWPVTWFYLLSTFLIKVLVIKTISRISWNITSSKRASLDTQSKVPLCYYSLFQSLVGFFFLSKNR